jgi:hypothetical protein
MAERRLHGKRDGTGDFLILGADAPRDSEGLTLAPGANKPVAEVASKLAVWIEHTRSEFGVHVEVPVAVAEQIHAILLFVASRQGEPAGQWRCTQCGMVGDFPLKPVIDKLEEIRKEISTGNSLVAGNGYPER